eukprot:jgi/Mesen1/1474/ME000132S00419
MSVHLLQYPISHASLVHDVYMCTPTRCARSMSCVVTRGFSVSCLRVTASRHKHPSYSSQSRMTSQGSSACSIMLVDSCGVVRSATKEGVVLTEDVNDEDDELLEKLAPKSAELIQPELMETEISIGARVVKLRQPKDVDEVIEMYIMQDRLDRDPYWCRLWPSAIALAQEILAHPELVAGRRVCDLGAGLGLAGLAAALAGAREVVLLDREALALQCALQTAHANIPNLRSNLPQFSPLEPPASGAAGCGGSGRAEEEEEEEEQRTPASGGAAAGGALHPELEIRGQIFDWCDKDVRGLDFDVVLACDVLYEKPAVALIAALVPRLLSPRPIFTLIFVTQFHATAPWWPEPSLLTPEAMELKRMERHTPLMDDSLHQIEFMHFENAS